MRKRRLIYNTIAGLLNQVIMLLCNFILPRQILLHFGSDVNGLVTSITQFLGFISLTEMGIGAVVQSSLYKPLADNDEEQVSRILRSARNFFNKVAFILLVYIFALCAIYPIITHSTFSYGYIIPLILSISISIVSQYFFGITNQLLLNADQRSYVQLGLNTISLIINTLTSIILMKLGASIQLVKFAASIALLIKPIGMTIFVQQKYHIDRQIELEGEPIKQKWNGIAQHIASFILSHTDVMVLTLFSTLKNVSIYNVYYMVVAGIRQLIATAMVGVDAMFGNLYATHDPSLERKFSLYEWIIHTTVTIVFSVAAVLICSFVSVYTNGITDANYHQPLFGALLVAAYGMYSIRLPYNTMVLAAGHYKQTQASAVIEAGINVALSIILVSQFGLIGVAIGTLVAMIYRTCYLAYYLSKAIIYRRKIHFVKHIIVDMLTIVLIAFFSQYVTKSVYTYLEWFSIALPTGIIAIGSSIILNILFYRPELQDIAIAIKHRLNKQKG